MKPLLKITLIVFALYFLSGCQSKKEPEQKYDGTEPVRTVIAGRVIDPPEDNTILMFIIDDIATARQLTDYAEINMKDSTFHFVFERYLPQDIMIKYGQLFSVFVHPGDSLFVTIDGNKLDNRIDQYESLKFSGKPAEFNRIFQKYWSTSNISWLDYQQFIDFQRRCTPEEIKHYADSVRNVKINYLAEFDSLYHPSDELIKYLQIKEYSEYISNLELYPYYYSKFNNIIWEDVVTSSYYDYFDELILNKDIIMYSSVRWIVHNYNTGYVDQHFKEKLKKEGKVKDTIIKNKPRYVYDVDFFPAKLRFIPEITKDTLLLQLALCEEYGQRLEGMNYRFFEKNKDIFDKYVTKPCLKEPLLAYYNEVKYKCQKPEIASQAILNDLKNTAAEKIYNRILEKNRGKIIYLDCWETTCSPCRAEMPYSKKLMAKFDTARVAFVYICFNSRMDAWKGLLSEWQLGGQHYFADRKQSKYLSKALSINGYPHYMLLDKNGNVVETGSRPSNDETYSKIMGLVAK